LLKALLETKNFFKRVPGKINFTQRSKRGTPLKGNYSDYREFHISGDLLLIYRVEDETLKLVRIGSHSELFN